jgi:hypothetical protein
VQWADQFTPCQRLVGGVRLVQSLLRGQLDHSVQARVDLLDALQVGLDDGVGGYLALTNALGQGGGRGVDQLFHQSVG